MRTQILCDIKCCENNDRRECQRQQISLRGCSSDSDHVVACLDFEEIKDEQSKTKTKSEDGS